MSPPYTPPPFHAGGNAGTRHRPGSSDVTAAGSPRHDIETSLVTHYSSSLYSLPRLFWVWLALNAALKEVWTQGTGEAEAREGTGRRDTLFPTMDVLSIVSVLRSAQRDP